MSWLNAERVKQAGETWIATPGTRLLWADAVQRSSAGRKVQAISSQELYDRICAEQVATRARLGQLPTERVPGLLEYLDIGAA